MKKLLSILLAAVLAAGLLMPGLGALSAFAVGASKLPSVTSGDLTFVVPEAIYLAPDARSWSIATSTPFQFYVNNNQNGTPTANAAETTGRIYYALSGAGSATLSYRFMDAGLAAISGGSVTLSSSSVSNGGSVNITGGQSPSLAAAATGCYLCWTLSFTENGIAKKAVAYTYIYKPYVVPVAAAAYAGTGTSSGANWAGSLTWLSGMHGITVDGMPDYSSSGSLDDYEENNHLKFTEFACFTSSLPTAYVGGTAVTSTTRGVASGSWAGHDAARKGDNRYVSFANTSGSPKSYAYVLFENNRSPSSYNNSASDTNQNWGIRNTTYAEYRGNNKDIVTKAVAKSIGTISIDTSRYSNLMQIPNLAIGLAVTSDKACDDGTGRWWISDITEVSFGHRSTWYKTDEDGLQPTAMERGYIIAGQGNDWHTRSYDTNEGIRYAGGWNRTLINTGEPMQMYYVKSLYGNAEKSAGSNYDANACGYVGLQANYTNKAALRAAVQTAIKKMPALGVNAVSGSSFSSCYFGTEANYKWAAFNAAYNAAAQALTRVDTQDINLTTLTANLNNAMAALQTWFTVNGNGGALTNTQSGYTTVGIDQQGIALINVSAQRSGYLLKGWNVDPNASPAQAQPANGVTVGYNNTVYAIWAPAEYEIKYNLDGGEFTGSYPATYTIEDAAITLVTPTRIGYDFTGWSGTGLTGENNMTVTIPAGSMGERTYTAHWALADYTITFDTAGGSEIAPITAHYGDPITKPANPTKEGHYFMYWTRNGSIAYLPSTMPAESYTVTANWLINRYTITFDTAGGSEIAPISDVYGTAVTPPAAPTKEGFVFAGWSPALPATIPGENLTVTAQWKALRTATFDLGGGSLNGSTDAVVYALCAGDPLTAPEGLEKFDAVFTGWSPAVPAEMPDENVTYTAQWAPVAHTATFDLNGGSLNGSTQAVVYTLHAGDPITAPQDPVRDEYVFTGWAPALAAEMPAADVTYTAQWALRTYTATFALNGGSLNGSAADVTETLYAGDPLSAPADPVRTGYRFDGWSPAVDSVMPAADVTYTAQWTPYHTATFYLMGGSIDGNMDDVVLTLCAGDPITAPADPELEGYIFTGWDPQVDEEMPDGDVGYVATWELAPAITVGAHSLSLNGDIGVNFYVDIPNATAQAYAAFSVDGESVTVPINLSKYAYKNGVKLYKFTCNVHSAQTATPITGYIYNGDMQSEAISYSVHDYLDEAMVNPTTQGNAKMMRLASALATYGYYANEMLGIDPDFTQQALFDDSGMAAVTAESLAGAAAQITDSAAGVTYYGSSLVLHSTTAIRHYFSLPAGKTIADFTVKLGSAVLTPKASGRYYYVEIPDIASAKLGQPYTVTVEDAGGNTVSTWVYSALSYAYRALSSGTATAETVNAAKALVLYYQAAAAYFNV